MERGWRSLRAPCRGHLSSLACLGHLATTRYALVGIRVPTRPVLSVHVRTLSCKYPRSAADTRISDLLAGAGCRMHGRLDERSHDRSPSDSGARMNRISSETTHIARTALATLHEARTTAETACQAYQVTLAQEQRSSARTDRVPVIVAGPPRAALEIAVAMLATCDAAAALALELSLAFAEASQVAALTAAVASTSRSASIGVRALRMQGPDDLRRQLAHASALASHQVADVLDLQGGAARAPGKYLRRKELGLSGFPLPWRAVVTGLGERLACQEVDDAARCQPRFRSRRS